MSRKYKVLVKVMLSLALIFSMSTTVFADDLDEEGKIVDGSVLTTDTVAETNYQNPLRGNILNQGTTRISEVSSGVVNVYGIVFGSVVCDKLILKMTLQRYENGSWINLQTFSDTAYNQSTLAKGYNVNVTKGYYYRVKTACVAQKGGVTETKMPVTDGIWID